MKTIHEAAKNNRLQALRDFLIKGIDINAKDGQGNTPLMIAVRFNHKELVKYLLERNANSLEKNQQGCNVFSLAKRLNSDLQIDLIIDLAKRYKYIEVKECDNKEQVINKLITTLLYKNKRHVWDGPVCKNIRRMITYLDSGYSAFTEQQYEAYIREQEIKNRDFYGSYLSDDSDSDQESNYNALSEEKKSNFNRYADHYQARGQLDRLFYKVGRKDVKVGSLKKINEASATFDLPRRTAITYGSTINLIRVREDLAKLNALIAEGKTLEEAQKKVHTVFYVAQYRGLVHLTSKWNHTSRVAHRKECEQGQPQYSASVYKEAGIELYKNYSVAQQQIKQNRAQIESHAETLKEIILTLREPRPCTANNYSYTNLAYLLQNIYTQDYDEFHRLLNKDSLLKGIFLNNANPFLSTGDVPYHALKYAYGIKPYKGHEQERLRPRWNNEGRAERPYSGVTYISLHPVTDYDEDGPLHLVSLNRDAQVKLKNELNNIAERESCFPAYMPAGRVIAKHIAKYPSFKGEYKQIYNLKYGITASFYSKLRAMFLQATPHSTEMKDFKKILGEWLCSYYEIRLIDRARRTAEQNGGILIYRDINNGFSFMPPIDSVNRNTTAMTEAMKAPIKLKQAKRASAAASSSQQDISILQDGAEMGVLIREMNFMVMRNNDLVGLNEDYRAMGLGFSLLLNALREKRYKALARYLSSSLFINELNETITSDQYENLSLLHLAVLANDLVAAKLLLSCPRVTIQNCSESATKNKGKDVGYYEGLSPLALAIYQGANDMVTALLESNLFDVDEVVSYLVNKDHVDDIYKIEYGSIEDDSEFFLGYARSSDGDISIIRNIDISLMHLAVESEKPDIVNKLIQAGAPCSMEDAFSDTPLLAALRNKQYEMANALLSVTKKISRESLLSAINAIPYQFRNNVINMTNPERPEEIPEDLFNLLIQMKNRGLLINNTKSSFSLFPGTTQANPSSSQQNNSTAPGHRAGGGASSS